MKICYSSSLIVPGYSFIPGLSKHERVMAKCYQEGHDEIIKPYDLKEGAIYRETHDIEYVYSVLKLLKNGFNIKDQKIVDQICASNGSMVAAVKYAFAENCPVFSVTSGFHHAGFESGYGYCTFNGIIIALREVKKLKPDLTALILDFDGHYGDGTEDLIKHHDLNWITHLTHEGDLVSGSQIHNTKTAVWAIQNKKPDIIIYQPGADSHIEDPYRTGYFTDVGWSYRDRWIFMAAQEERIPIVWNMAGGYGQKTVDLHHRTFRSAIKIYEPNRPCNDPLLEALKGQDSESFPPAEVNRLYPNGVKN